MGGEEKKKPPLLCYLALVAKKYPSFMIAIYGISLCLEGLKLSEDKIVASFFVMNGRVDQYH